jgi:hypothetical protein
MFLIRLLLLPLLPHVIALKHHLFVGTLSPPASIYTLEFDDQSLTFRLTNNITSTAPHSWLSFNVRPPFPFPTPP